ncbi:MAG: glycogen debranching protein, partial [Chlamydiales bacterium]
VKLNQRKYISQGNPSPLGATVDKEGVNFAVYSPGKVIPELYIFEGSKREEIVTMHKTGNIAHIAYYGLTPPFTYRYKIGACSLLDPYAREIDHKRRLSIVSKPTPFDWKETRHPLIPYKDLIIYEMHVRGFTIDPTSKAKHPGTFLGIIEKIPYLKSLGVNALELMPIFSFPEDESLFTNPVTGTRLGNYWGYSTIGFFSLMHLYGTVKEFKKLVRALHAEGMEIILDVVYNHTAEHGAKGPTYSFKGFSSSTYYIKGKEGDYANYTGCGNTLNCNHPVVIDLIRESLSYWVTEMQVDGFRFDLASTLTRDEKGDPLDHPPLFTALAKEPSLKNTKFIAEPWDPGGLFHVGNFPGGKRWAEWNGLYSQSIRRFLKGTDGEIRTFATRICGSQDLYGQRRLENSVIYFTVHDGFTLRDLISYNEKKNIENGEDNRDGNNSNESWNCGYEGETTDREVLQLRQRQMKNFIFALFISQGVPLLLMGDEYGRSQNGNNNTWGHDTPINWFNWEELQKNKDFFSFCKLMIQFRKNNPHFHRTEFLTEKDITWCSNDWSNERRSLSFILHGKKDLFVVMNALHTDVDIELPKEKRWKRVINTALPSPQDILEIDEAVVITAPSYTVIAYSSLLLISE